MNGSTLGILVSGAPYANPVYNGGILSTSFSSTMYNNNQLVQGGPQMSNSVIASAGNIKKLPFGFQV